VMLVGSVSMVFSSLHFEELHLLYALTGPVLLLGYFAVPAATELITRRHLSSGGNEKRSHRVIGGVTGG
jgi:hypothetical protein